MSVYWAINYLLNLDEEDRKKIKITLKSFTITEKKKKNKSLNGKKKKNIQNKRI